MSPSKADEEKFSAGNDKVSEPALRKSPCKNSRKTLDVVTEEEPPAMIGMFIGTVACIDLIFTYATI